MSNEQEGIEEANLAAQEAMAAMSSGFAEAAQLSEASMLTAVGRAEENVAVVVGRLAESMAVNSARTMAAAASSVIEAEVSAEEAVVEAELGYVLTDEVIAKNKVELAPVLIALEAAAIMEGFMAYEATGALEEAMSTQESENMSDAEKPFENILKYFEANLKEARAELEQAQEIFDKKKKNAEEFFKEMAKGWENFDSSLKDILKNAEKDEKDE